MNLTLILTTIATSAADSLNPVAITQQFVLQGMVKKRHHIWYFILATYVTNFTCGMMAYYGLIDLLAVVWGKASSAMGVWIFIAELVAAATLLLFGSLKLIKASKKREVLTLDEEAFIEEEEEAAVKSKIRSVSPLSLFSIGVLATIMELTSALPYFAFLGVLLNYRLAFIEVFIIQAVYNLIYASPLILLYLICCKKQKLFDRIYTWVKHKMEKIAAFITPILFLAVGVFFAFHSITTIARHIV